MYAGLPKSRKFLWERLVGGVNFNAQKGSFDISSKGSSSGRPLNPTEHPSLETSNSVYISFQVVKDPMFLCDFDCSTYTGNVNSSQYQGYFQAFLSTTVFFWKIEFFQERNKFSFRILTRVSLDSFLNWYIYVAKTLKLINYYNTSWVHYRLHCSFMKYGDADRIFWEAMLVALCCGVFGH